MPQVRPRDDEAHPLTSVRWVLRQVAWCTSVVSIQSGCAHTSLSRAFFPISHNLACQSSIALYNTNVYILAVAVQMGSALPLNSCLVQRANYNSTTVWSWIWLNGGTRPRIRLAILFIIGLHWHHSALIDIELSTGTAACGKCCMPTVCFPNSFTEWTRGQDSTAPYSSLLCLFTQNSLILYEGYCNFSCASPSLLTACGLCNCTLSFLPLLCSDSTFSTNYHLTYQISGLRIVFSYNLRLVDGAHLSFQVLLQFLHTSLYQ